MFLERPSVISQEVLEMWNKHDKSKQMCPVMMQIGGK